jgi:hypothetical protein
MFPAVVFGAILNADDSSVLVQVVGRKTTCNVQNNTVCHCLKIYEIKIHILSQPNKEK